MAWSSPTVFLGAVSISATGITTMTMPTFTRWALTATAAALLAACGGDSDNNNDNNGGETPAPYTLQLLHFADMDGATGAL